MAPWLVIMNFASRRPLDVVAGHDAEERRGRLLRRALRQRGARRRRRDVREPCLEERLARRGNAPDVAGPMTATTALSAMNFCAMSGRSPRPARPACHRVMSPDLEAVLEPSVLTAYFAQLSCSVPRKPAPPVNGQSSGDLERALAADCLGLRLHSTSPHRRSLRALRPQRQRTRAAVLRVASYALPSLKKCVDHLDDGPAALLRCRSNSDSLHSLALPGSRDGYQSRFPRRILLLPPVNRRVGAAAFFDRTLICPASGCSRPAWTIYAFA